MNKNSIKKILVTGGAGFIGSHFVDLVLARDYEVLVIDALTYSGNMGNLNAATRSGRMTFRQANIVDQNTVFEELNQFKPHAVVNFAAETHVDRSISGPAKFIETNITGTYSLLEASLEYFRGLSLGDQKTFRFVQISTDEVFGSLGLEDEKFSEKSIISPNSPYAASKAAGDHLVKAWHETYGLPTIVTHCSNNFGSRQYPEKLIPVVIQKALSGKPIPVYGNGKNIRDWIHVEDHCTGILLALEKGEVGERYCFGGNDERSNIDLVNLICQRLDERLPKAVSYTKQISYVTDRLGHDFRYAVNNDYSSEKLGFRPIRSLNLSLGEVIDWYIDFYRPQKK